MTEVRGGIVYVISWCLVFSFLHSPPSSSCYKPFMFAYGGIHIWVPICGIIIPWGICIWGNCWFAIAIAMGFIIIPCWFTRCALSCSQKGLVPPAGKPAAFHMRYGWFALFCFMVFLLRPLWDGMMVRWMPASLHPMVFSLFAATW